MKKKDIYFLLMVILIVAGFLSFIGSLGKEAKPEIKKDPKPAKVIPVRDDLKIILVEEKPPPRKPEKKEEAKISPEVQPQSIPNPVTLSKKIVSASPLMAINRPPAKAEGLPRPKKNDLREDIPRLMEMPVQKVAIKQEMVAIGRQLMGKKESIPIILADYNSIGFQRYFSDLRNLGGRLFVGDPDTRHLLAEVSTENRGGDYAPSGFNSDLSKLEGMALWRPREITNELLAERVISEAQKVWGKKDLRVAIIMPYEIEAAILGALAQYMKIGGYELDAFETIWGKYSESGGRLALTVYQGRQRGSQQILKLNMTLVM